MGGAKLLEYLNKNSIREFLQISRVVARGLFLSEPNEESNERSPFDRPRVSHLSGTHLSFDQRLRSNYMKVGVGNTVARVGWLMVGLMVPACHYWKALVCVQTWKGSSKRKESALSEQESTKARYGVTHV
ncbi:uncharacterized protein LOC143428480 [Xylocopa sonorina]|uniref:uncharacterized protein LOC143428480 n=1 Tax=Xylocopa sonorina TaxID=1818115 RepID=UPI00403B2247